MAVVGDAIPQSLTGKAGDAARGREISFSRDRGNCIVCHVTAGTGREVAWRRGPQPRGCCGPPHRGPNTVETGRRAPAQPVEPHAVLLSPDGLKRVATAYAGKTVLTAEEIEDVLAYLMTLRPDDKR